MKRTPLRRISTKKRKQNEEYTKLRKAYLEEHPVCKVCESAPSTEIHHMRGRGSRTNDVSTWLSVCRSCHYKIHYGANHGYGPKWAREHGFLD